MERMIKDLKDGESYIFANNMCEYSAFAEWLDGLGWKFAYHFETGVGFQIEKKNGRIEVIEVYFGL